MNTKTVFSRVATRENTNFGAHDEIRINLTLKKVIFSFLLCFKIAKFQFIPVCQALRQKCNFFSSRFASNLMLPACLLGMIMVVNVVCN